MKLKYIKKVLMTESFNDEDEVFVSIDSIEFELTFLADTTLPNDGKKRSSTSYPLFYAKTENVQTDRHYYTFSEENKSQMGIRLSRKIAEVRENNHLEGQISGENSKHLLQKNSPFQGDSKHRT